MYMHILFPLVNTLCVGHCILQKSKIIFKKNSLHFSLVVNSAKSPDKDKS